MQLIPPCTYLKYQILKELNIEGKVVTRGRYTILYLKDRNEVGDVISLLKNGYEISILDTNLEDVFILKIAEGG